MEIDTSAEIYTPPPLEEPNGDDMQNSEERPNKRRRKKSIVWEHFTIEPAGPSCMKACCKHCKKLFSYTNGPKLAGTNHLKRHISMGICTGALPISEATPNAPGTESDAPKRRCRTNSAHARIPFDQERCTRDLAKMIIQHDYPLHIVEHPAFIDFVHTLHPQYNMVSFNTIQGECVALYLREKQSLLEHISEIPGRVNLTLDLATSNLSIGYAFLTGHFINSDWNLERRILNVIMLPFPDSDYAFNQAVISCISDWQLENKLLTITVDKAYSNQTIMGNLRGLIPIKNSLLLNGQLLKGSCYAHLLSQLAQDAMARVQEPIKRIRESVKYVKTSETHEEQFAELRQKLQVPSTMELVVDDLTKWNTTYQMLAAACELKEVFCYLDTADPVYKINPLVDDWKQVEVLCKFLKLFFEAASTLTAPVYSLANAFYHEVANIQLELSVAAMSQDRFVSTLTRPLKEKFDEYWRESSLVLAVAVVMDPRFKMKLVEFSFSKIFGEDAGSWIKSVDDGIHELFLDYIAPPPANLMIHSNTHASQSDPSEGVVINGPSHGFSSLDDQSLLMHGNSHLCHSDAPPEVAFVPEIGGLSEEFSFLDGQSHRVPSEELQPEEKKPLEKIQPEEEQHSQKVHAQELVPEKMRPQELPSRDSHPYEASGSDDTRMQDVTSIQETSTESTQEARMPGLPTEEVPAEDVDMQEVPAAEEVRAQEAPAEQLLAEEAPALDPVSQEAQSEELVSHEAPAKESILKKEHAQDSVTQDAPAKESVRQETPAQDLSTEKAPAREQVAEEAQAPDSVPEEAPTQDSIPVEAAAQELPPQESLAEEMLFEGVVPSQDMISRGVQTQEMFTQETQLQEDPNMAQDMQHQARIQNPLSGGNRFSEFEVYISAIASNEHLKSELDRYLEEPLLDRVQDFDVLGWWKENKLKYPTLSRLAADILSIPLSTVGPESVFDTASKKIDSYHGALHPLTLEAIVCVKDWLQNGSFSPSSQSGVPNAVTKLQY